jgi:hypothetical protein
MALILMEGFDITSTAGIPDFVTRFPTAPSINAGGRFGGAYASAAGDLRFIFPSALSAGVCGAAFQRSSNDPVGAKLISLYAGATEVIFLRTNAADLGTLEVVIGSTVVGSAPKPTPLLNTWAYVEVGWTVGAGTGKFQLAWNGVQILDLTGLAMGTANITEHRWVSNVYNYIDDLYLLDLTGPAPYNARLGDCRVETLLPNGDGASSQWLGSDGNSVNNSLLVDENPVNTTDYVAASAVGLRDLYAVTDPSGAGAGDILAVQVQAYMAKSDAGAPIGNLNGVLRLSTGEVTSLPIASGAQIASTYATKDSPIATVDPTGAAWTGTAVTNLQAGVEVV